MGRSRIVSQTEGKASSKVHQEKSALLIWDSYRIVSNNDVQFQGEVRELLRSFKVEYHKSSPYRPQANGAVEAINKNIKKFLLKMTKTYRDWSDRLPYALWGYQTIVRTSTGATHFSLVYRSKAVLLVKVEIISLQTAIESELPKVQWA